MVDSRISEWTLDYCEAWCDHFLNAGLPLGSMQNMLLISPVTQHLLSQCSEVFSKGYRGECFSPSLGLAKLRAGLYRERERQKSNELSNLLSGHYASLLAGPRSRPKSAAVLDLGCGNAHLGILLAHLGYDYIGVDIHPMLDRLLRHPTFESLSLACGNPVDALRHGVSTVEADLRGGGWPALVRDALAKREGSHLQFATMSMCIEYIDDEIGVLRSLAELLRDAAHAAPGSYRPVPLLLFYDDQENYSVSDASWNADESMAIGFRSLGRFPLDSTHEFTGACFSRRSVEVSLRRAGFNILSHFCLPDMELVATAVWGYQSAEIRGRAGVARSPIGAVLVVPEGVRRTTSRRSESCDPAPLKSTVPTLSDAFDQSESLHLKAGEPLFVQSDTAHELYVVRSGRIGVFFGESTEAPSEGVSPPELIISPGESVGDIELFLGPAMSRYEGTAIAMTDCEVACISRDLLMDRLGSDEGVGKMLYQQLIKHIHSLPLPDRFGMAQREGETPRLAALAPLDPARKEPQLHKDLEAVFKKSNFSRSKIIRACQAVVLYRRRQSLALPGLLDEDLASLWPHSIVFTNEKEVVSFFSRDSTSKTYHIRILASSVNLIVQNQEINNLPTDVRTIVVGRVARTLVSKLQQLLETRLSDLLSGSDARDFCRRALVEFVAARIERVWSQESIKLRRESVDTDIRLLCSAIRLSQAKKGLTSSDLDAITAFVAFVYLSLVFCRHTEFLQILDEYSLHEVGMNKPGWHQEQWARLRISLVNLEEASTRQTAKIQLPMSVLGILADLVQGDREKRLERLVESVYAPVCHGLFAMFLGRVRSVGIAAAISEKARIDTPKWDSLSWSDSGRDPIERLRLLAGDWFGLACHIRQRL